MPNDIVKNNSKLAVQKMYQQSGEHVHTKRKVVNELSESCEYPVVSIIFQNFIILVMM